MLLEQYPRDTWPRSATPMAQFWLQRHEMFRREGAQLAAAANDYRAGRSSAAQLAAWSAPRLQAFLGSLYGHHQVEDFHYFPAFRAAENRLAAGFDILARDHELLHAGIIDIVERINTLITTIRGDGTQNTDAQRHAADRYVQALDLMYRRLDRHLDDEEDLIIPLMMDRGE